MPWALGEYSVRWIRAASAEEAWVSPACFCQYCMTMAMLAAPQPSFSCLTKGTSSHRPPVCAPQKRPQRHTNNPSLRGMPKVTKSPLADGHDDQHQHHDGQDDPDQLSLTDVSRGKVRLRLVRPRRKVGQVIVVQSGDRGLHLLRIDLRLPHRLLSKRCGEKSLDRLQVLLPRL